MKHGFHWTCNFRDDAPPSCSLISRSISLFSLITSLGTGQQVIAFGLPVPWSSFFPTDVPLPWFCELYSRLPSTLVLAPLVECEHGSCSLKCRCGVWPDCHQRQWPASVVVVLTEIARRWVMAVLPSRPAAESQLPPESSSFEGQQGCSYDMLPRLINDPDSAGLSIGHSANHNS